MLSAALPTFRCHLRRGTPNNSIFFFFKVIDVLLIVHDSRTLLLGTSVGLGGQYNSDINDNIIVNDTLT